MHKRTKTRLYITIICLSLLSLGIYLILHNLEQNIVFFYPPSKIELIKDKKIVRVGGLVKKDSIIKIDPVGIQFTITDNSKDLVILYKGLIPALFRENQGVVAQGVLSQDIFIASDLLIKHDENYKPPT